MTTLGARVDTNTTAIAAMGSGGHPIGRETMALDGGTNNLAVAATTSVIEFTGSDPTGSYTIDMTGVPVGATVTAGMASVTSLPSNCSLFFTMLSPAGTLTVYEERATGSTFTPGKFIDAAADTLEITLTSANANPWILKMTRISSTFWQIIHLTDGHIANIY